MSNKDESKEYRKSDVVDNCQSPIINSKLEYGHLAIEYTLCFKNRKTLGIRVYPDCSVHVIAPEHTKMDKIREKLKLKAAWILKQQQEFLSFQPLTPERMFVNGETHLYLG